jgi:hypothetical protein
VGWGGRVIAMPRRYGRAGVLSSAEGAGSISDLRRRRALLGWGSVGS